MNVSGNDFRVAVDCGSRVIEIQGIRYSFDLFNALGFAPCGARFEIGARSDGVVELRNIDEVPAK